MFSRSLRLAIPAILLFVGLCAQPAGAGVCRVISASFGGGGGSGTTPLNAASQPGVIPVPNWNIVPVNPAPIGVVTGVLNDLVDNTGAATSLDLSYSSSLFWMGYRPLNTSNADTNSLYTTGLGGNPVFNPVDVQVVLSQIPFPVYDIYVYASQDTPATNTLSTTIGSQTFFYNGPGSTNLGATGLTLSTSTNAGSPTTGLAHYQIFRGLSGASQTIQLGGSIDNVIAANIFGFQVVGIPEPSTTALTGIAGLVGVARLLRRRLRNQG